MRMLVAAALAVTLSLPTAHAESYQLSGTNPDGSAYTGRVEVTDQSTEASSGNRAVKVTWIIGGDAVSGTGLVDKANPNALSVGFLSEGALGAATATRAANGSMTVLWWVEGSPGTGTELWTPEP